MADIVDKKTRSRMMAGIKGKDTKPELSLRRALHSRGLRYRLHVKNLPGRPDIVLPKHKVAIQVQGCFWHRHEHCSYATTPASNSHFWHSKFIGTIERDRRNLESLKSLGWRVVIAWECSIRRNGAGLVADRIITWLRLKRKYIEI